MTRKLTRIDIINIAKGIVEWRLDEGKEQDGRYGVVNVQLDDFLRAEDIELTDQEYEDIETELYDAAADVHRAAERAVENYITNQQQAADMQRLMSLFLKHDREGFRTFDEADAMAAICKKWSIPNA